ncbi:hypothetical protein QEO94_11595 [Kingella negevensis]|uniref:hypothetical protein n=2 Tax=Kingella negevensis TaxID=1522312 RepID=UPI0025432E26|nr:hypothetical protein [Kingella negevensis]WII93240.1 hypothetical protein QEO94_11595 [Kingella negevensis]
MPSTIIWQPRLSRIMIPATTFQAAFNGAMAARRHFAPLENQLLRPTYRAWLCRPQFLTRWRLSHQPNSWNEATQLLCQSNGSA